MKRIGEILVNARAITERTRDDTLAYMRENKVSFGTALLETGGIGEETLLRALSVQSSSPPVGGRELAAIPAEVTRLVPQKLAQKHMALPFRKVGNTLYLAMARPRNNPGTDEIAFLTGMAVLPHVALTVRLIVAMEKYYGVQAPQRLKTLVAKLDGEDPGAVSEASRPAEPDLPSPPKAPSAIFRIPFADGPADPWKLSWEPETPVAQPEATLIDDGPIVPPGRGAGRHGPRVKFPPPALDAAIVDALGTRLAQASGPDEIGEALLEVLKEKVDTIALFMVKGDAVRGWRSRPAPPSSLSSFSIPFSEPSVFSSLRVTSGFFAGPCPDTPANRRILEQIGVRFPALIGVVPVTLKDRTVVFLVAEAAGGTQALQIPLLRRCAAQAATALEILALQKRLRGI